MARSIVKVLVFVGLAAIWLFHANCAAAQDPELFHCNPCMPVDPGPAPDPSSQHTGAGGAPDAGGGPGTPGEPGVEPNVGIGSLPMHPPAGATLIPGGGNTINHSQPAPPNQHYELRLIPGPPPPDIPEPQIEPRSSLSGLDEALKFATKWAAKAARNAADAWAVAKSGVTSDSRPERVAGRSDTNPSNSKSEPPTKTNIPTHIDKDRMADAIDRLAQDTYGHKCAANCRMALEAAGIDTTGHPEFAKDYGPFLQDHGFEKISLDNSYTPQKGEVAVFAGNAAHEWGHIEIFDGKNWVSDTKQTRFSPYSANTPSVQIYRFKDRTD